MPGQAEMPDNSGVSPMSAKGGRGGECGILATGWEEDVGVMLMWLVRQRKFCLMHQSRRRGGLLFTAEEQTMSAGRVANLPAGLKRLGDIPDFVSGGPHNPMGARALYLFQGSKDTLFRVHGTNQPEYIGQAISSGCIRLTNEDVIDLYNRVKVGAPVVVLRPKEGDSPSNPRVASTGFPSL